MSDVKGIRTELDRNIPESAISEREGGSGKKLSYLEGWFVIARLNEVLGQGNWEYDTEEMKLVHSGVVENYGKATHVAHYIAKVRLTVHTLREGKTDYSSSVSFSDYGYGDGQDKVNPGKAHELAVKEAVTDAIKRCAKNLGMSMGLALYDKSREFIGGEETIAEPAPVKQSPQTSKKSPLAEEVREQPEDKKSSGGGTPEVPPTDREELNKMISSMSKVIVAKKTKTLDALRVEMTEKFGTNRKEELDADKAGELYSFLRELL